MLRSTLESRSQHPKIALSLEGRTREVLVYDQRLGKAVVLLLLMELPRELVRIAQDSLQDVAPQTRDLLDITPFLWAETHHLWLSTKVPRDDHFAHLVHTLIKLYTHPLSEEEMILCVDEKTNLQPRPRLAATLPTRPGQPIRLENEYKRAGALHLLAAFDSRTGQVSARTEMRKRQGEFIALLTQLDREIPPSIRRI